MGRNASKPVAESPLLDEPWRQINWKKKQDDLEYVKNFKPQTEGQQLRILLHVPVGAGKSSFINSVQTVLRGRICALALVDNISHDSFTKEYTTYKIQKDNIKTFYPFVFTDIMGLTSVMVDDIKLALLGHVKEGYGFNPGSKLTEKDQSYKKTPTANDKVHVLVCVVPADTLALMNDKTTAGKEACLAEIRDIRLEASRLGIPQVAVLTKVDQACPEIKKDVKNIYMSKSLRNMMREFSVSVGIPMNCIFPVKNYHEEIELNAETDALILSALGHIVDFGEDFINYKAA